MSDSNTTKTLGAVTVLLVALSAWLLGSRSAAEPAIAAAAAQPAASADRAREGVLVSGTGQVFGAPDTLEAHFAAEASGDSVDIALRRASSALDKMRKALVDGGVAEADIQTSGVDIYPRYGRNESITGYQVSHRLTVKIRDLDKSGGIMSAAVAAGGNAARLSGVSFAIEEDSALLADARRKAFADAKAKAELYAQQAGRTLGQVVSVTETVNTPSPTGFDEHKLYAARADFAIEPGQQQLAVTVTVEWAFG